MSTALELGDPSRLRVDDPRPRPVSTVAHLAQHSRQPAYPGGMAAKDFRNPPQTDEGVWAFVFDDNDPREYVACFRHLGLLTAVEAADYLLDSWRPLGELVFDNGVTLSDLRASVARTLAAAGMPVELDARAHALVRHLRSMTPPRSPIFLPLCEQALDAAADGDYDRVLRAPPHTNLRTLTVEHVLYDFELDPEQFP